MRWDSTYQEILDAFERNPFLTNATLAKKLGLDESRIIRRIRELRKAKMLGFWVDRLHPQFETPNRTLIFLEVEPAALRDHPLGFSGDKGLVSFLTNALFDTPQFSRFKDTCKINRAYSTSGRWDIVAILYSKDQATGNALIREIRNEITGIINSETRVLVQV